MIVQEQAYVVAREHLDKMQSPDLRLAIMAEETEEHDFGWVFYYQSEQYVETGDIQFLVAGNAPLIINRNDGSVYVTGTAYSIEKYIEEYRKRI